MLQVVLAYVIQAEREREIAEMNRQRRLLTHRQEAPAVGQVHARTTPDPCRPRVGARVAGS